MKITIEYLEKLKACPRGLDWFRERPDLAGTDYETVCAALEEDVHHNWSFWLRQAIGYSSSTPSAVLERLGRCGDWFVRRAVARNPNTSSAVLAMLAGDRELDVRKAAKETLLAAESAAKR